MEKTELIDKTKEVLSPFETENIVKFMKELSFDTIFSHPIFLGLLLVVAFYAIFKRSKFLLLFLFTCFSVATLLHFFLPESGEMTLNSLLPFAGGGVVIGAVIIYFGFIQGE